MPTTTRIHDTPPVERRRYPRFSERLPVHFHCLKSSKHFRLFESVTKDIGAGGLAMVNGQSLEKGQLIMVTVFLPGPHAVEPFPEKNVRTFFLSRVAWEAALPDAGFLQGVEFLDIAEEDRKRWHAFLGSRGLGA
jgi:c-di-GMP-binding flagellar brake protein YcgR